MSKQPSLPPTLQRVLKADACSGCGLCAGVDPAIGLRRDRFGWWRPFARAAPAPETDALMARACPGARLSPWANEPAQAGGSPAPVDPLWGPYQRILTGHATDPKVRHAGSSGGTLSALAIHLLNSGKVDRVLHVAMDPAAPLLTAIQRSTGREGVLAGAGSRYAPAAPLAEINAELERGGRLLVIGKPCDVGAIRELTRADPAVAERIPYILSFFCAGTPSQRGTDRILDRMQVKADEVASFRYRGDGWPGFATATRHDGSSEKLSYAKSWGEILAREVQFRCKVCADSIGGAADVAAADAWYGDESGYPTFDEADGRSLILPRTRLGDELVREAEAAGILETTPLDRAEIARMQPYHSTRRKMVESRLLAVKLALRTPPDTSGVYLKEASRLASQGQRLESTFGTFLRIIKKRLRQS